MTHRQDYDAEQRGQWRRALWAGAAGLYLVPVVLKLSTGYLDWGAEDFVFVAVLIFGPVAIYDATTRRVASGMYRAGMGLTLLGASFLIFSNASVGIIGGSEDPANLLYLALIAIGLAGGFATRLAADGMARTMLAVAAAQALITLVAVLLQLGYPASGPLELIAINAMFIAIWLFAAFLFSKGSRVQSRGTSHPGDARHA